MSEENILDFSNQSYWSQVLKDKLDARLNHNITRLNLSSCHIDKECWKILHEFLQSPDCKLLSLDVSDTRMSVSEASMLFSSIANTSIIEFYADNLILKEESIQKLSTTLASNSQIQVLSLCGCDLNQRAITTLAEVLPQATELKYLRLESNSMYDIGALEIAKVLPNTNLISLEIADNMIWEDGISSILESVSRSPQMQFLDISYNVLPIPNLIKCLKTNENLTGLAISGCKVEEQSIPSLLTEIINTKISTFIMDGLDYKYIPVAWPKIRDSVFEKDEYFNLLHQFLLQSKSIEDIRLGYLNTAQIKKLMTSLSNLDHNITLTLQDFYKTGDFYVLHFPDFHIDGPSDELSITCDLNTTESDALGEIIASIQSPKGPITKFDISMEKESDSKGIEISLASLAKTKIEAITMSLNENSYTSFTLNGLMKAIEGGALFSEITMHESRFTEEQFAQFFDFLNTNKNKVKNITIGLSSSEKSESYQHKCMESAKQFFQSGVVEFYLEGDITPADVLLVCGALQKNKAIQIIDISTNLLQTYKSPDPKLNQDTISIFKDLAKLLTTITSTKCALHTFNYPLFTEIYMDDKETLDLWLQAKKKIDANHDKIKE